MANLENKILNYAQEGAEGSGNSFGAHLLSKLAEGNADPKLVNEEIRQRIVRGGRGSKGEPSEIKESIEKAKEEAVRIDSTLTKLKNEKEGLLRTIADFRIKEKQLVETGRKEEVEAIRKAIVNAQNEVDKINGVIPESVALDDHKKIQSIVSEWYTEKQKAKEAAGKIKQAEKKLESTPDDGRVLGDAIRGKTEKAEADEQLAQAEREAELILNNKTPNPVRDEGIHHTNEETVEERNFLNRRRSERVAPGIFGHSKENEEMQKEMNENATISEIGIEEKNMKQELPPLEFTLEPTENKPLQSAYDMAMDRIWKENEAKRNAVLMEKGEEAVAVTERVEEIVGTPKEGQETAFEKFENTAEEKNVSKERALSMIASMRKNVEAEAEKKKVPEGWVRRTGEAWNKVPTRYKLLLTAGMFVSGVGSAALGATTAVGALASIGAGLRAVGGAGLFVAIENGLKNRAEKKGDKRSGVGELRDTTLAAALSIIIVGVLPNMARDYAVEHGLFEKVSEFFGFGDAHVETPVETVTYVETAKAGDSIWKMAEHQLETHYGEKFTSLSPEKQTYLIDAVKDKITLGMSEETANTLAVGQSMDFKQVFTDKDFMNGMFSNAQNLTPEQITNIQNYDASASVETPARTVPSEEFLNEQLHTTFTPEEASAVIPTPEQTVLPAESYVAHTNAFIETSGMKGSFRYSPSGAVSGFSFDGTLHYPQTLEPQKLLNDNWRAIVLEKSPAGMGVDTVRMNANTVFQYEQMLNALEQKGAGTSPEADFLRKGIEDTVNSTEKTYGDVFKNVGDFNKPEKIILSPAPVKDVLMEGVIHEASEQSIPTSFIQPEIIPGNTAELAYVMRSADAILNTDMDILFGESKFLGFGHTNGIDSINWKDPQVGFGGKTVTEIMNATPNAAPAEGGRTFGVENYEATSKMKEYLASVTSMTGVNPNSNEKVVDFIRRASIAKLSK